jgi:hypothetical protein
MTPASLASASNVCQQLKNRPEGHSAFSQRAPGYLPVSALAV